MFIQGYVQDMKMSIKATILTPRSKFKGQDDTATHCVMEINNFMLIVICQFQDKKFWPMQGGMTTRGGKNMKKKKKKQY